MGDIAARTLTAVDSEASASCIPVLRQLLEEAERGDLIGFSGVAEYRGSYRVVGTATLSRTQTAGALLDAAITRLAND